MKENEARRPLPPIKRGELNSRDKLVEDARQKFYAQGRVPGEGISNRLRRQHLRGLAYNQMTPDEYDASRQTGSEGEFD